MAGSTQEKMILMAQMASEGDTPGKLLFIQKYFPLAFFFLTASVISWLTVVYTQEWEAQLEEEVAVSLSSAYSADLKASFDQLIHDAQIVKGLVDASEFVSDEEFDVFTQALLSDNVATEVSAMLNYRGLNYITSLGRADSTALLSLLRVPENGQQVTQIVRRQAGLLDDYVIRYFPLNDAQSYVATAVSASRLEQLFDSSRADAVIFMTSSEGHQGFTLGNQHLIPDHFFMVDDFEVGLGVKQKVIERNWFQNFRWFVVLASIGVSIIFLVQFIQARISVRRFIDLTMQRTQELTSINGDLVDEIMQRAKLQGELLSKNSELSSMNSELEKARDQLLQKEKLASLGQMSAGIAHEINNPVGFIKSNLNMLGKYCDRALSLADELDRVKSGVPEGEMVEHINQLQKTCKYTNLRKNVDDVISESMDGIERVQRIVSDLKMFSRPQEDRFQVADINRCILSSVNIAKSQIPEGVQVHYELGELPELEMVESQISQVIVNLVVNSAQAISSDGNIYLRSFIDRNDIIIEVEDDGCGIEDAVKERIFDPFFTTKDVGEGTGLGLSLSYGIIEQHQGRIRVDSEVGKGTCFRIALPFKDSEQDKDDDYSCL
ncbi:sensor histidine kinase [uncultured Thalassolituus sp.]|uniref:sensor histidine kinase n=1 Tax=uncultured Thalassolituus sp. TaxID=285273 RepID=UPI002619245A|nr:ATP-binding protein [uncultured Thalassolituus sp.]